MYLRRFIYVNLSIYLNPMACWLVANSFESWLCQALDTDKAIVYYW